MHRIILHIVFFILLVFTKSLFAQDDYGIHGSIPDWVSASDKEISPVLLKTQLIFLSDRLSQKVFNSSRTTDKAGKPVKKLFILDISRPDARISDVSDYASYFNIKGDINSVAINKLGTRLYLGKNRIENATSKKHAALQSYGIFESVLQNGRWSDPVEIKELADPPPQGRDIYSSSHISIAPDGKRIYFVSNRPGGSGEFDIWYSDLQRNGQWGIPINMGKKINTEHSETYPVANPDGRLYFSRDSLPSRRSGKRDPKSHLVLYYTEFVLGQWVTPERLPDPINSGVDNFNLVLTDASFTAGYWCTGSQGMSDIKELKTNFPEFPESQQMIEPSLCYFFEESEGIQIDTLKSMWEWDFGKGEIVRALNVAHCFPDTGDYMVRMRIYDKIKKISNDSNVIEHPIRVDYENVPYFSCSDTVKVDSLLTLKATDSFTPCYKSRTFFWEIRKKEDVKGKNANTYTGEVYNYRFRSPGKYQIMLGVVGKFKDPLPDGYSCPDRMASYREIVVVR